MVKTLRVGVATVAAAGGSDDDIASGGSMGVFPVQIPGLKAVKLQ